MAAIKLLKAGMTGEVTRLQSQLCVGRGICDFILEDGKLKNWKYGKNGTGFYEVDIPYVIVESKEEMEKQEL